MHQRPKQHGRPCPQLQTRVRAQVWLLVLLLLLARASVGARVTLATATAALSAAALPPGLWRPQLRRLGGLAAFMFVLTAIGAGAQEPGLGSRIACSARSCVTWRPGRAHVCVHCHWRWWE